MVELSSVVAGPIVRRVEPGTVSVWLALGEPARVGLQVFDSNGAVVQEGTVDSVGVGKHLHLALVTATGDSELLWGQCYTYELTLGGERLDVDELLYEGGEKRLSFVLPGATLEETQIVHGSCRHPTNRGDDAMAILDDMVLSSFAGDGPRPQVFVCSGDLVYADSPSPSLLALLGTIGDELLGYAEVLPELGCQASEIVLGERGARPIPRVTASS